jgi:hypothetical protein
MDEQLLTILKLCLLALLYLFFLRVLRAVWTEVRGPRTVERRARRAAPAGPALAGAGAVAAPASPLPPAAASRGSRRSERRADRNVPTGLAIVEPANLRGTSFPLLDELTVGRAAGCHVTLDDTFASQIHARVFSRDGQLFVEDLGSTNGTYLNRTKVAGPQVMHRGDRLQVGNTVLELV